MIFVAAQFGAREHTHDTPVMNEPTKSDAALLVLRSPIYFAISKATLATRNVPKKMTFPDD